MAILSKGHTFADNDSVTSTKLNNAVDNAAFVPGSSGTTDDASLEVNSNGRLQIKDSGVTNAKLGANAVTTAKIASSTTATDGITYAKLQRVGSMRAIGNVSGSLGVAAEIPILEENDMASNSAAALATQQSIKTYVDTKASNAITIGTAQATTSGTLIDFTGIPSTVKRITVMLDGVSTSGTGSYLIQLGTSSGVETTGYLGSSVVARQGAGSIGSLIPSGIGLYSNSSSSVIHGIVTITKLASNTWIASASFSFSNTSHAGSSGSSKTLSGVLDRIRLTTSGGADTFDAGQINISYE